ncbi:unnamed protein product [marine sediment metagenome]|jgi:hypothetical protein|uniref:Uncharacterized protein n=1 Tax=marine sediment metagenome TaxID=412755 RepID=X0WB52_9ZZZZ
MGAMISLAYMLTKIGEYFYPKEDVVLQVEDMKPQIIVNIGEYNYHFDYKIMEEQAKISKNSVDQTYIEDAVYDIENNISCTI